MMRGTKIPTNMTNTTNTSNGCMTSVLVASASLRKPLCANQHGGVGECWSVLVMLVMLVSVGDVGHVGGRS